MRLDDISGRLQTPADGGFGFRQGVLVAYDAATGSNSVNLAGGILTDLPILIDSDGVNLVPGDAIVLLKLKSSLAIMGRVVTPGSGQVNRAANKFEVFDAVVSAGGFAVSTTPTTQQSVTLRPPAWATHAEVMCNVHGIARNTSASTGFISLNAQSPVLGTSAGFFAFAPANEYIGLTLCASLRFSFAANQVPFLVSAQIASNTAFTADANNAVYLSGVVTWSAP